MYYTIGQARWTIGIIANIVSGVGAGIMWTAQADFFNISARNYARAKVLVPERATAMFAALFVSFYLGLEVMLNLVTSAAHIDEHRLVVFIVFSGIAIGSAVLFGIMVPCTPEVVPPCGCIGTDVRTYGAFYWVGY